MNPLVKASVGRTRTVMTTMVLLVLAGITSYLSIPKEADPDIAIPFFFVSIPYPGISPGDGDRLLVKPMETELRTLEGLEEIQAFASQGFAGIILEFDVSFDKDQALQEVREKVDLARAEIPTEAEEPIITEFNASLFPVLVVALSGDVPERALLERARKLQDAIEAVPTVLEAKLVGDREELLEVVIDPVKLESYDVSQRELINAVSLNNQLVAAGALDTGQGRFNVKVPGLFESREDVMGLAVKSSGEGVVTLDDIADIRRTFKDAESFARFNGGPAIVIEVTKRLGSNIIQTNNAVRAIVEEETETWPKDIKISYTQDQSSWIYRSINSLEASIITAISLVMIVVVAALGMRSAILVGVAIPTSFLIGFFLLALSGLTVNMMVMFGLLLAVGMLVDNAVVVVENIVRLRDSGEHRLSAAAFGTRQIMLAVTCATMTTVIVFMPMIFMTENPQVRVIMGNLGIPLSISLIASLLVATVFLPVIAGRILGKGEGTQKGTLEKGFLIFARIPVRVIAWLAGCVRYLWFKYTRSVFLLNRLSVTSLFYLRWLAAPALVWCIWLAFESLNASAAGHDPLAQSLQAVGLNFSLPPNVLPIATIVAASLALVLVFAAGSLRKRKRSKPARPATFVPKGDSLVDMLIQLNQALVGWALRRRFWACLFAGAAFGSITIPMAVNQSGATGGGDRDNDADFRVVFEADFTKEEAAEEVRRYQDYIESKKEEIDAERWLARYDETGAQFQIYFKREKPNSEVTAIETQLKDELPRFPGHRLVFYEANASTAKTNSVARFQLTGPDSRELERLGALAEEILQDVPGLDQVTSPLARAPEMIEVKVDRELALGLGVTSQSIQNSISWTLGGWPLSRFHDQGREIPLKIEYDDTESAGLSSLRDLAVNGMAGQVALASFADLGFTKSSRRIYRRNGQTSFTIEAKVEDPLKIIPITEAAYVELAKLELPRGFAWDRSESAFRRTQDEMAELQTAFLFATLLVFLLMAFLFESLALPFSVLFSVPFAILGAQWILMITGTPFDAMGMIGYIILAGVVVNNGIVLIDRIGEARGEDALVTR